MVKNLHKIIGYAILSAASIVLLPEPAFPRYRVSGVVEFSYRGTTTETGDTKISSNTYWTQYYRANLHGDVLDPRFLRFTGGVGYSKNSYKNGSETDTLDYTIQTSLLSGLKVSADLFTNKSTQNVESAEAITGYDIETETYGGTLRLGLGGGYGRNNNNYNNGSSLRLPDITLSKVHIETESFNPTSPLSEIRDDTRASLTYGANTAFAVNLDGIDEKYEELINGSYYETKTAGLYSTIQMSPDAKLLVNGHYTDRHTDNITGYVSDEATLHYVVDLTFREKDGFRHYYRYNFNNRRGKTALTSEHTTQRAEARFIQRVSKELELHGGFDYKLSKYFRIGSAPGPEDDQDETYKSGGLDAGLRYAKVYAPAFMGPFVFDTGYEFGTGFTSLSDNINKKADKGRFYTNDLNFAFRSEGWKRDNMVLSYSYSNKRDHSIVANNYWQHAFRLALDTVRIPKTQVRGNVRYTSMDNSINEGSIHTSFYQNSLNEARRSYTYDLSADYRVSSYVNLLASASRGQDTTTPHTISSLATYTQLRDLYYVNANITYPITRRLRYRARLGEELRVTETNDTRSHRVQMYLDYRVRRIFVRLEYRWWQDIPENSGRSVQSYYYAKLSRPF